MIPEYLTELEAVEIEKFNNNPVLADAIKKVLLDAVYNQGVIKKGKKHNSLHNAFIALSFQTVQGGVISNERLGEDLRAMTQGLNFVEAGFKELSKIKTEERSEEKEEVNPAI